MDELIRDDLLSGDTSQYVLDTIRDPNHRIPPYPPYLPISPHISLGALLAGAAHISPSLPISPHISPYLLISPRVSLGALVAGAAHISPHLPTSPHSRDMRDLPRYAEIGRDRPRSAEIGRVIGSQRGYLTAKGG